MEDKSKINREMEHNFVESIMRGDLMSQTSERGREMEKMQGDCVDFACSLYVL
jgi:hypothetical protein